MSSNPDQQPGQHSELPPEIQDALSNAPQGEVVRAFILGMQHAAEKQSPAVDQSESVDSSKKTDSDLEPKVDRQDSLAMFLASLGGATLGVLLTLMIIAVINDGTLTFASQAEFNQLHATVNAINENVGILSENGDVVASGLQRLIQILENAFQGISFR